MIPVIDMRNYETDKQAFAQLVGQSLHEFGFFRLVNHTIPQQVIDSAKQTASAFWALPEAVKDKYNTAPYDQTKTVGYIRNGELALSADKVDIKEEWGIRSNFPDNPVKPIDLLDLPDVPGFGKNALALFDSFQTLAVQLMRSIAIYSGEPENIFDGWTKNSDSYMRFLHYPQGGNAAGHLDFNILTLLDVDEPGLFVRDRAGKVHEVTTGPGELIVNGGMQLGMLTNDHLRPSGHWVVADRPRNSIPFFYHTDLDYVLKPIGKYAAQRSDKDPSYFPSRDENGDFAITARDFKALRIGEIYDRAKKILPAKEQESA